MLTPHDWQMALYGQSACNLQGIVRALHRALPAFLGEDPSPHAAILADRVTAWVGWFDKHSPGRDTDWLNKHPYSQAQARMIGMLTGALPFDPPAATVAHAYPRLWAEQFLHLTGLGVGDHDSYQRAYAQAEARAAEPAAAGSSEEVSP